MATVLKGLKYHPAFSPIAWEGVNVDILTYGNGRIALQLWSVDPEVGYPEPLATATVNMPQQPCGPDEVWVKDWSENEGMTEWLAKNEIILPTPVGRAISGHVMVERFKLTESFQKKMFSVSDEAE